MYESMYVCMYVLQVSASSSGKLKQLEGEAAAAHRDKLALVSEKDTLRGKLIIYEEQVHTTHTYIHTYIHTLIQVYIHTYIHGRYEFLLMNIHTQLAELKRKLSTSVYKGMYVWTIHSCMNGVMNGGEVVDIVCMYVCMYVCM